MLILMRDGNFDINWFREVIDQTFSFSRFFFVKYKGLFSEFLEYKPSEFYDFVTEVHALHML